MLELIVQAAEGGTHALALDDPALTFALALAAGVLCQVAADHLRLPGIVLFLIAGVILGPDGLDLVRPVSLGSALHLLVGLAVAVILFEGGLSLNIKRLRHEAVVIRRLITLGALISALGGALAARWIMGWDWRVAILFGTLVIVTGPTVITPLLRRIRVNRTLHTISEAEGVLIDPVGAVIAVVTLELLLASSGTSAALGLLGIPLRLLVGALVGLVGGFAIGLPLRSDRWVPEPLVNVFTLAMLLACFEVSEALQPESGITAAVVAGLVVGNLETRLAREIREFKEQLTVMLVGMLFVILAADVRIAEVQGLGWPALGTVAVLMFLVRPLNVAASTWGSSLSRNERTFLAWMGPRGIVAAAVAALFADRLAAEGLPAGPELRAMVFTVIAVTVLVQGLSGGLVAGWLGVRRTRDAGFVIAGANALARTLAGALAGASEEEVVLVDANPVETARAKEEGFSVIHGNANERTVLARADVEGRRGFIAATPNEGINMVLARSAREEARDVVRFVALNRDDPGVRVREAHRARHHILFGREFKTEYWLDVVQHDGAETCRYRYEPKGSGDVAKAGPLGDERFVPRFLVLTGERRGRAFPMREDLPPVPGEIRTYLVVQGQKDALSELLEARGWVAV